MAIDNAILTIKNGGKLARPTTDTETFVSPQQGIAARPTVYREEPIDTLGEAFSAGIESGFKNIRAQNQNFLAAIDTLRGDDVSARNRTREADFLEDQSGIPLRGLEQDFASSLEQKDVHGFFLNMASATGQFIPSLAASLAEAVVVGGLVAGGTMLSGGTATPGLLAAAGAGTAARRKGVETGVKRLQRARPGTDKADVEDLLDRAYRNQMAVSKGNKPPFNIEGDELNFLDEIYAGLRANMRGKRFAQGAVLGAFTQEQRMGTGIAFSDYVDQGMDTKQDALDSILQGTVFGAVGLGAEAATVGTTLRAFKRPGRVKKQQIGDDPFKFDPIPPGSAFKDFASITAVTAAGEGLAELLQEELSVQQKFRIDDTYTKAQARIDRVNALFAGLMGGVGVGGGLGAGTAVMNKARNMSQRNAAEREMMRIFSDKETAAALGAVMGERSGALETQFDFVQNENNPADSVFVPIEAKAEFAKVQANIEKMFEGKELFSVSTPVGAFFTTDQRKAGRLANIMDSGYKYDTGVLEDFLSGALGYSRTRDPKDNAVVGVFDNEKQEFTKYQSAQSDNPTDMKQAENAMKMVRGAMDPKRYTIETQSLAQHRRFRQEGLPKDADVLKATKQAFETDPDSAEMNTSDDDAGVEGDRGQINLDVTAANIDIKKGLVTDKPARPKRLDQDIAVDVEKPTRPGVLKQDATPEEKQAYKIAIRRYQEQLKVYNASQAEQTRFAKESETYRKALGQYKQSQELQQQFDTYLKQVYRLPINFNELVTFVNEAALVTKKGPDALGDKNSNRRKDFIRIYGELVNAEKNAGALKAADRAYLQRINSGDLANMAMELELVLDEIAEEGTQMQQSDSIDSSLARDEFGSRTLDNIPLIGVSEILNRTNVTIDMKKPEPKDFKGGKNNKAYKKELAIFNQQQKEAKGPLKEADPIVMSKKGSGTAQNPFVDPKTDKGFQISKDDPKADGRSIAGLNTYIHTTLKTEFNEQKPFLSKRAVETFREKAKIERENTKGTGFLRFVEVRDLQAFRTATAANESFTSPERNVKTKRFVIVRMKPDAEQFREITRENVDTFRNVRADLQIRLDQAHARTRGKGYDTPIHFKLQNLNKEAKSQKPINIDIAVLLEGISTISKIQQRRAPSEYMNQGAQRLNALIDAIDLLQENNFKLVYYPEGVTDDKRVYVMTNQKKGRGKPSVQLGFALQSIVSQPDGPGAGILKITYPKDMEGDFAQQSQYLYQQFGLPKESRNFYTTDKFARINEPLIDLVYNKKQSYLVPGMDKKFLAPLLQDIELNEDGTAKSMQDMTLDELETLMERAEDAISVRHSAVDTSFESKAPGELKNIYGEIRAQDKTILQFLTEVGKVVNGINAYDVKNAPGTLDTQNTRPVVDFIDDEGEAVYKELSEPKFVNRNLAGTITGVSGPGGVINREVPISNYINDIKAIAIESSTPHVDETGMYGLEAPTDTQIIDNSSIKMDLQDKNLFESYTAQQGKEFVGRDRYADMSRGIPPKFKDNTKYKSVTVVEFQEKMLQKEKKLAGQEYKRPEKRRQNLPFRKQIVTNLIAGARNLGLITNLHIISAEADFSDSSLKASVKNSIDQKQFEAIRTDLLSQKDKLAKTLQYADFDIILMKTNANVSEGQYYSALLKELGNSLTFQELEKSLKVPATRKKLLQAYEKIRESKDAPETYTNNETGFENFVADQFGIAIRKELGLEVDGKAYDQMNGPARAWFTRLAKSQKKMFNQSKTYRKRTEVDESFQEYAAELQEKLVNPANQQASYTDKASIETMIDSILGPETASDKQIRKAMEQAGKIFRSKKLPTWMQKIFLTADTRLRNYGPIGVQVADFFNQDPRTVSESGRAGIFTLKTRRANAMHNKVAKILGVEDGWIYSSLTDEQRQIVNQAADDTKSTRELSPKAQELRNYLEEVYDDLGLERYGIDKRKNFFPRVVAVAEIAGNENLQIVARQLLKEANPKATDLEIHDAVNGIVKLGSGELDFNPQDKIDIGMMQERKKLWSNVTNKQLIDSGLALPAEVGLQQYLDKLALKYEFEQSGGVEKLNGLIEQLKPAEQTDARNIIDSMFGKTPPIDKGWLKLANNVLLPVNIITLLAFTVLASLQDTAGPVLRSRGTAKISDIASVIKTMVKDPTEAADLAREVGVIGVDAMSSFFIFAGEQNFMNQTAKGVSDTWFRVTLLEAYTKFTRVFATGMGTRFLQDSARKAQKGDSTAQLYLKELNVTAEQVLAWEEGKADTATREKVNEALAQFVDESIVRPNPAQRPTYANNPRYALIWQLKSFFYAYGKTIVFPTLKESHRNFVNQGAGAAAMPLLMMAGILVPITMLGLEIRELTKYLLAELLPGIDGDDPGVNYFKTNSMSTGQYMTEIIDRSGMLGPFALALPIFSARHRYGQPFWVPPLGPAAEKIYDGITWDWRVADYIPGYSQLDTRNLGR